MTEQEAIKRLTELKNDNNWGGSIPEALDMAISALERNKFFNFDSPVVQTDYKELLEYRKLGTLEEFWEAIRKAEAKKPKKKHFTFPTICPICGMDNIQKFDDYGDPYCFYNYCPDCGQKLDWNKNI